MDRLLVLKHPLTSVAAHTTIDLLSVGELGLVNDAQGNANIMTNALFAGGAFTPGTSVTARTKWRFVVGGLDGLSYSHDINPDKLSWAVGNYVAGAKQVTTYTFSIGTISNTNILRFPIAINFNVYDLRQDGDKNITPNRITFKQSFYWNAGYTGTSTELQNELKVFVKKINSLANGRYTASVTGLVVTITASDLNVKFNVGLDNPPGNIFSVAASDTTSFAYADGTLEQVKQLEYRVSPSYGHNPVNIPGEDNIYTHKSEIDDTVAGYHTLVIRSGNEAQHDLFVADNAGLIGTTYLLIPDGGTAASTTGAVVTTGATAVTNIVKLLTAIKALRTGADSPA
jgi:hypothetical protein